MFPLVGLSCHCSPRLCAIPTTLSAPSHLAVILSPTSLTEFPAYWAEHPELFADISEGETEEDRMERVLLWFIATLKGQYTVRGGACALGDSPPPRTGLHRLTPDP